MGSNGPVFNSNNELCLIIACLSLLDKKSKLRLKEFAKNIDIRIIEASKEETFGTDLQLGSFATNSLPLAGKLLGSAKFETPTIIEALSENNIQHIVLSLSQFRLSGGSVHCLTNEF